MAKPVLHVDLGSPADGNTDTRNNISDLLAIGIDDTETDITVSVDGALFNPLGADREVFATIDDGTNIEVVKVTSVAGNVLTVVRGWENSGGAGIGYAFLSSVVIERRITQGLLQVLSPLNPATGNVEVGSEADSSGADSIAVGPRVVIASDEAIGIGVGVLIPDNNNKAVVIGADSTITGITGDASVLVGPDNTLINEGQYAVAVGSYCVVDGSYKGVAVGRQAEIYNGQAMSLGSESINDAVSAVALGYRQRGYHTGSLAAPPRVISRTTEDYDASGEPFAGQMGGVAVLSFPPMDLGAVPDWTTGTEYVDQNVVADPTPAGTEQFFLCIGAAASVRGTDKFYRGGININQSWNYFTSGTEPTWTATDGDQIASPAEPSARWICTNPVIGCNISVTELGGSYSGEKYMFVPTRIGFYAYDVVGTITINPKFDFGNEVSTTAYLTAQEIDGLADTKTHQMQWFPLGEGAANVVDGAENLVLTLDTVGTGSSIYGRFVVEGYYMAIN